MLQWIKKKGKHYAEYQGVEFEVSKGRGMLSFTLYMNGKAIVSRPEASELKQYALEMIGGS